MKKSVENSLNQESINRAYYVTKKLSEMNDKIAHQYDDYQAEMYEKLAEAQSYIKLHGRHVKM